ncbi:hypothetical protein KKC13_04730 [bacterium]|nr:hypothetical protein [bacterium]MBU1958532.1 hypothetical protein [bacterium]
MNFRTFFFILFVISIALCIGSTFTPDALQDIIYKVIDTNYTINTTFLGLLSLITAILSYIGLVISTYFGRKREIAQREKEERDRLNIEAIHAEIQALHKEAQ